MLFNTTRKTSAWLEDAPKHGRAYLRAVAAGTHLSPAPLSPDSAAGLGPCAVNRAVKMVMNMMVC